MTSTRMKLYAVAAAAGGVLLLAGVPASTLLPVAFLAVMVLMHVGGHGGHGGHGGQARPGAPDDTTEPSGQDGREPVNHQHGSDVR